jgi:predicted RNA-binding Zn ribbon-like protein
MHLLSIPRDGLCLDFINTRYWRGTPTPTEELRDIADVVDWVGTISHANGAVSRLIGAEWRTRPQDATAAFAACIALREILHRVFSCAVAGSGVDLSSLNIALSQAAPRRRLVCETGQYGWEINDIAPSAATLLSPVLWSAADLMAGPRLARLRQCANPKCGFLFLDDSKAANRRWCSMAACGNRAKAQRHYQRHKAS